MSKNIFFDDYFGSISKAIQSLDYTLLEQLTHLIKSCKGRRGKIIIVGNGGSAAIASHVAVDFTKAAKIRATNFNEADLITCFANDYGYENWVAEALKVYADADDIVILISSSGQSLNLINAAKAAKNMGLEVVTLTGFLSSNPLREVGDINLWVDSRAYNVVESAHQTWLLALVDYVIKLDSTEN
jgi:D-sedoheptulose 7-phosphate isomerase